MRLSTFAKIALTTALASIPATALADGGVTPSQKTTALGIEVWVQNDNSYAVVVTTQPSNCQNVSNCVSQTTPVLPNSSSWVAAFNCQDTTQSCTANWTVTSAPAQQ